MTSCGIIDKALQRLEDKINYSSNITKSDLKLSHYTKFLDISDECNIQFKLNNNKIIQDKKLDGIKGYITKLANSGCFSKVSLK